MLEDFNLSVKVGENVAIMYVIFETSTSTLLIIIFGDKGRSEAESHSLLLRYYDPVQGKITYDHIMSQTMSYVIGKKNLQFRL